MTSTNLTNFDPVLKQLYGPQKVESVTYSRRPFFARINKFERFGGRNMPLPLKYGNPQGRSASFTNAQSNTTQVRYEDFVMTRVSDYSVATLTGETAEASRDDNMAFLEALTSVIDAAMESLADSIETFLFRDGTGSLGVISAGSTVNSGTITLATIHDITNFEVGMTLVSAATAAGAVRTGSEVLAGLDRGLGTLDSTSTNWDDVTTAIATGDFLFVQGDAANTGANVKISGLEAWVPTVAPTSTLFFGVDRSVDVNRLGGNRFDGSSGTVEEALIDGQSVGAREGANIDQCYLNHIQVRTLKKELGSRIEYEYMPAQGGKGQTVGKISFRALMLEGDHGPIEVYAANKCPAAVAWLIESRQWKLYSLGAPVKFLMQDGLRILRQASADGYEVRVGFRGQLGCSAPGFNTRVTLSVPS